MEVILPVFKNPEDRNILILALLLALVFGFIPFLLVLLFLNEKIGESSKQIIKSFLNFELLIFLISVIAAIPIVGFLVSLLICPLCFIVNLIVILMALLAISNNQAVKIPVFIKFIQ